VQSNPVVEDVSAPPVQKPTGTTEPVAIKSPPAAEIATPPVKSAARDVTVTKPPGENRFDRPAHPSRAYSVRPDGAVYQWRKVPPSELSVALVADERFGGATHRAEAS
jgi:hypothetical protein